MIKKEFQNILSQDIINFEQIKNVSNQNILTSTYLLIQQNLEQKIDQIHQQTTEQKYQDDILQDLTFKRGSNNQIRKFGRQSSNEVSQKTNENDKPNLSNSSEDFPQNEYQHIMKKEYFQDNLNLLQRMIIQIKNFVKQPHKLLNNHSIMLAQIVETLQQLQVCLEKPQQVSEQLTLILKQPQNILAELEKNLEKFLNSMANQDKPKEMEINLGSKYKKQLEKTQNENIQNIILQLQSLIQQYHDAFVILKNQESKQGREFHNDKSPLDKNKEISEIEIEAILQKQIDYIQKRCGFIYVIKNEGEKENLLLTPAHFNLIDRGFNWQKTIYKKQIQHQSDKQENNSKVSHSQNLIEQFINPNQEEFLKLHKKIKDYTYLYDKQPICEYDEEEECNKQSFQYQRVWREDLIQNSNQFNKQKNLLIEELIDKKIYPCEILVSTENENLFIGYKEFQQNSYNDLIIQIKFNPTQEELQKDISVIKNFGFSCFQHIEIIQNNIHILTYSLLDCIEITQKLEQLIQHFESDLDFFETDKNFLFIDINHQIKKMEQKKDTFNISIDFFKFFFRKQKYLICQFSNSKDEIEGIMLQQVNKNEIYKSLQEFVLNSIFKIKLDQSLDTSHNQDQSQNSKNIPNEKQDEDEQKDLLTRISKYNFEEFEQENQENKKERIWSEASYYNVNKDQKFSEKYLKQQKQILSVLQNFEYNLCKCFQSNEQEDIFIGYSNKNIKCHLIFIIKQNPTQSEIEEYFIIRKFNQNLTHLVLSDDIQILILEKTDYIEYHNLFENFKPNKKWSKEQFIQNIEPIRYLKSCNKCKYCKNGNECYEYMPYRKFSQYLNQIIKKLEEKYYRLIKQLAKGGSGLIFEGIKYYCLKPEELVFKVLFDEDPKEEIKMMKVFELYGVVAKFVDHIRINDEVEVLVLQKFKYSLFDELTVNKEFPQEKLVRMITQLVEGLVQFKIYNIIHLDIKPMNILVSDKGNYVYSDFGISSIKIKDNKINKIKGYTEKYASPEQLRGDANIDFQSDIYSLGKTLLFVFKFYEEANNDKQFVKKLQNIVQENMIKDDPRDRINCLELHKLIFEICLDIEGFDLLSNLKNVSQLSPFDQSKYFPQFSEIILQYYENNIYLLEKYSNKTSDKTRQNKSKEQVALIQSQKSTYYSYYLGDYQKGLDFALESLKLRSEIFGDDDFQVAQSQLKVGRNYSNLDDNENALKCLFKSLNILKQDQEKNILFIVNCLDEIGICYKKHFDFQKSLEYLGKSLQIKEQMFFTHETEIIKSLNIIGLCFLDYGDYDVAFELLKKSFQSIDSGESQIKAEIMHNFSLYCENKGYQSEALQYKIKSLKIIEQIFKENHPQIAQLLLSIGNSYENLGENEDGLKYKLKSLEMMKLVFNQNSIQIACCLSSVGFSFHNRGDNRSALKYFNDSLRITKIFQEKNHPQLTFNLDNFGDFYVNLGDNQIALDYYLQSLKLRKQIYQQNHQIIARSLIRIGVCYLNLGNNQKAIKYLLKSHQMWKQVLGNTKNHLFIIQSLRRVGNCYEKLDDQQNALKYYLESLDMSKQIFNENHIEIVNCLERVGHSYYFSNEFEQALYSYKECLKICQKIVNNDNEFILFLLNIIGISYLELHKDKKALKYFLRSMEICKQIANQSEQVLALVLYLISVTYLRLGEYQNSLNSSLKSLNALKKLQNKCFSKEYSFYISIILYIIGFFYQNNQNIEVASNYFQESEEVNIQIWNDNDPSDADSFYECGRLYEHLDFHQKALDQFLKSLEIRKKTYKVANIKTLKSLIAVGRTYLFLDENQKALGYLLESFQMAKLINKESNNHIDISLNIINLIVTCYQNMDDDKEALEFKLESLKMREKINSESPKNIADSLNDIGDSYLNLFEYEEAKKYYQKSLQIRKQIFQDNNQDIAQSLQNIGISNAQLGNLEIALKQQLKSLKMMEQIPEADPLIIADFNYHIGRTYMFLTDEQNSLKYLQKALQIKKEKQENDKDICKYIQAIGIAYQEFKKFNLALEYHLQSLEKSKKFNKESSFKVAQRLYHVGLSYISLEENKKALDYFIEALKIMNEIPNNVCFTKATIILYIGHSHFKLNNYQKALDNYQQTLQMMKEIPKQDSELITDIHQFIGTAYQILRNYKKAVESYQESLQLRKQIYNQNHPKVVELIFLIGVNYGSMFNIKKALENILQFIEIQKQDFFRDEIQYIQSINFISIYYQFIGDVNIAKLYEKEYHEYKSINK